jgi:purine-cytosine permease-like protein
MPDTLETRPDSAPAARPDAPPAPAPAAGWREGPIGRRNVVWGWCGIVLGPTVGSILMAWCFAGPFPAPVPWLEDYESVERRMLRLAHVAMVMVPLINIVFGHSIDATDLPERWKRRASWLAALAIPGVPLGLTLGALFWVPLKYLSVPGVYAFIAGLAIMAWGKVRAARRTAGDGG